MITALVVAFLAAHGLVHLAVWLPHPEPDPDRPPPFEPDHSALLAAAAAPVEAIHRVAVGAAVAVTTAYLLAALLVAIGGPGALAVTLAAAALGLVQKALFFHPWLSLGVLIDAGVLAGALVGWPVSL
jgi:hypothetical protein